MSNNSRCTPPKSRPCGPVKVSTTAGLASLVHSYKIHNKPNSLGELTFFRDQPSLELAIRHAGLAIDARDKRYSHQCRIPAAILKRAKTLLTSVASQIETCGSFHELHSLLSDKFEPIPGLGELYVYDTALRLGAFLKLSPQHVYLHAGTRDGARALGLDLAAGFLELTAFPAAIQVLAPHEIEDFLCIYKTELAR